MGLWGKIGHNLLQAGMNIGGSFIGDPMLGNQVMAARDQRKQASIADAVAQMRQEQNGPGALSTIGSAIGKATTAAGQNRLNQQNLTMQANRDNIAGNSSYENSANQRAQQEATERKRAFADVMRANDVRNPNISQFNTRGPRTYSPEMMSALTELEKRGLARINMQEQYTTDKLPKLAGYTPMATKAKELQKQTGTEKGLMESIGDWAGPGLSILDMIQRNRMEPGEEWSPSFPGDVEF